jgi:hypothetical protein
MKYRGWNYYGKHHRQRMSMMAELAAAELAITELRPLMPDEYEEGLPTEEYYVELAAD